MCRHPRAGCRSRSVSSSPRTQVVIPAHAGIHSLPLHSLPRYDIVLNAGSHFLFVLPVLFFWIPICTGMTA